MDNDILNIADTTVISTTALHVISALATIYEEINKRELAESQITKHTLSLSGQLYTEELLQSNHEQWVLESLHMSAEVFSVLCNRIHQYQYLKDTRYTTVEHQMYIFLFILTTGSSNQIAQEWFQKSGQTISRIFKSALNAINAIASYFIQQPTASNTDLDLRVPEIQHNSKLYPFFKDCLGAIDGSLMTMSVPLAQAAPYRTHKGYTAQNVFIACAFDCTIQFTMVG